MWSTQLKTAVITMSAQIDRHLTLEIAGKGFNTQDIVSDRELAASLTNAIAIFVRFTSRSNKIENFGN